MNIGTEIMMGVARTLKASATHFDTANQLVRVADRAPRATQGLYVANAQRALDAGLLDVQRAVGMLAEPAAPYASTVRESLGALADVAGEAYSRGAHSLQDFVLSNETRLGVQLVDATHGAAAQAWKHAALSAM